MEIFKEGTSIVNAVAKVKNLMSLSESRRLIGSTMVFLDDVRVSDLTQKLSINDSGKLLTVGKNSFRIMVIEG